VPLRGDTPGARGAYGQAGQASALQRQFVASTHHRTMLF
jgi:hypothetical protein